MRTWVIALIVFTLLVVGGGCSPTSSPGTLAFAPGADAPDSGARGTSALDWGTPIVLDSTAPMHQTGASVAVINGNPAVAYQIWGDQGSTAGFNVYYVRANDPAGSSWGSPVSVDFWPYPHQYNMYTSLCEVSGKPAIAYNAMPNGSMYTNLYFARARDAEGNRWGTPLIVNPPDDDYFDREGEGATMRVVDGNPAIWYQDAGDGKYVRALDQTGRNWGTPSILGSFGGIGSFEVVNGNPAVILANGANGEMRFLRADSTDGSTWNNPPITVLESPGPSGCRGLAVVEGFPAIAFSGLLTDPMSNVRYIRALNADGTSWPPAAVDATIGGDASVERFQSIAVINGLPSIAVSSGVNEAAPGDPPVYATKYLSFVQAADSSGAAWDTPESLVDLGGAHGSPRLVATEPGAGIAFLDVWHAVNYIGSLAPPPDPGGGGFMHLGDLVGDKEAGKGGRWRAVFTVKVEDSNEGPVSGADVAFSLSGAASGSGQVTTGTDGTATYQTDWLRDSGTVTFTVNDVTHATMTYDPAGNHNGNSIAISGP